MHEITAEGLGSAAFRSGYGVRFAYLAGAMYRGIASRELVVAMARGGMMGFFGTGGLSLTEIEAATVAVRADLGRGEPYGFNLLSNLERPEMEERTVDLYLRHDVRNIEAAAFMRMTPALVRWRLSSLRDAGDGRVLRVRRTLAKVSRPEVATAFLQPAPETIVAELLGRGLVSRQQAELARRVPMADDVCVEADSAGHTDRGVAFALIPSFLALRDEMQVRYRYDEPVNIGAAGGIGTPEAVAAAFMLGADFVTTGSINQCTVEAGTSDAVKDLLQQLGVHDTAFAPAGDLFEIGSRVQVAARGLFFPSRANKLYELYQRHDSLEQIDPKTRNQIEERYFRRSFDEVWAETREYLLRTRPDSLPEVESQPKKKMALVLRWYFVHSTRLALIGSAEQKVDYQIHCGPAMGAFNQWVRGTALEPWRQRRVADIGQRLMNGAAGLFHRRIAAMRRPEPVALN